MGRILVDHKVEGPLSLLSWLLTLMRPSSLFAKLDHKVCYLCHSFLTLARVMHPYPREPPATHRTRFKDLAAQTYICWQKLLAHCQTQRNHYCSSLYSFPWE
ncbi:unnamed protein product [Nyctereutes procyonoides]|uniref:(raccoon dog) hypothetical protein n=1 Tax=Nyctereutes procyonoides TaxID=34880 RepID=A0A811YDJ4_NYCPR|nr:unnamed protein product [Nyctereutes procyonoides]